jgi:hypothetical protein
MQSGFAGCRITLGMLRGVDGDNLFHIPCLARFRPYGALTLRGRAGVHVQPCVTIEETTCLG